MSSSSTASARTRSVEVIAPGMVFIKNALNADEQVKFANYALGAGDHPEKGFWTRDAQGNRALNADTGRGRIYDAITKYPNPEMITELCQSMVGSARALDTKMPLMNPTHLLLLYYATAQGMYWHTDSDENDGDNDHPIVSVSIGNSCDFGFKIIGKAEQTIRIESGDVLIWGGPNRMLLHAVHKVYMGTTPEYLPFKDARLNFTFRDAPNVLGRERLFEYNVESNYTGVLQHLLATVKPATELMNNRTKNASRSPKLKV